MDSAEVTEVIAAGLLPVHLSRLAGALGTDIGALASLCQPSSWKRRSRRREADGALVRIFEAALTVGSIWAVAREGADEHLEVAIAPEHPEHWYVPRVAHSFRVLAEGRLYDALEPHSDPCPPALRARLAPWIHPATMAVYGELFEEGEDVVEDAIEEALGYLDDPAASVEEARCVPLERWDATLAATLEREDTLRREPSDLPSAGTLTDEWASSGVTPACVVMVRGGIDEGAVYALADDKHRILAISANYEM